MTKVTQWNCPRCHNTIDSCDFYCRWCGYAFQKMINGKLVSGKQVMLKTPPFTKATNTSLTVQKQEILDIETL